MSTAEPVIVTLRPDTKVAPASPLAEIVAEGAVVSVEATAKTRLASSVCGRTPISAKRLTMACWTAGSVGVASLSWFASSAQLQ